MRNPIRVMSGVFVAIAGVAITGCASKPVPEVPPPPEPMGFPVGLAWIEARGEVAVNSGSVEHVLLPPPYRTLSGQPDPPSKIIGREVTKYNGGISRNQLSPSANRVERRAFPPIQEPRGVRNECPLPP